MDTGSGDLSSGAATALSRRRPKAQDALSALSFYIGRAYYNYIGLLSRLLKECMGHILFALFERDNLVIKGLAQRTFRGGD